MKQKLIFPFLFLALYSLKSTAQEERPPMGCVQNSILHGNIGQIFSKDIRNFLTTLHGDKNMSESFSELVAARAKKDGKRLTYVYRGNMISYSYETDSLRVDYNLWLIEDQNEGVHSIKYTYKGKNLAADTWIYPNIFNNTLSKLDSMAAFKFHAEIALTMMKADLFIPHPLSVRLSYNMAQPEYLALFKEIAKQKNLIIINDTNGNLFIRNKVPDPRLYTISSDKGIGPTFEVSPKWNCKQ